MRPVKVLLKISEARAHSGFDAALVVFNAERLNSLAAQHYQSFTDQPYFDKHGIFFSALISAPLLLSMFILLVSFDTSWQTYTRFSIILGNLYSNLNLL